LVRQGKLKGPITAEQLLWLLRSLGINVRLETKIQVYESGELNRLLTSSGTDDTTVRLTQMSHNDLHYTS